MDQLRWGITSSAKDRCWSAKDEHAKRSLCTRHALSHAVLWSPFLMERVFILHIDDGKSIYVTYFKHLTVAVISQLMTALLKAGCARTGMNIIHQTDVTEKNLGQVFCWFFFKANFSIRSIQCSPSSGQRKKHQNINWQLPKTALLREKGLSNSITWHHCGIRVRRCRGAEVNIETGTTTQSVSSHPCFRQVTLQSSLRPCAVCWAFAGTSTMPSQYRSWCNTKKISYHSGFQC